MAPHTQIVYPTRSRKSNDKRLTGGGTLGGMKPIGQRLRELREAHGPSQEGLGDKLSRNQRWVSERERGVVGTTVEEAAEITATLGFAGEFVILPPEYRHLLGAIAEADPQAAALGLRLVEALPHLDENVRDMLVSIIESAERSAASKKATGS
jgi:transcriptional regulator with XRE-family HTH domain